ncbi:hypothetical protein NXW80_14740 [Bacteroides fragilis]|nr:hypothetical protein [Bacteroides fragilis]
MKRIKIEDTLYNVPESWDDVTLGQYEKWFDYVADTKMKEVELVSLISTIPFDLLSTLPLSFYTDVLNMVSFAFAGNDFKPSNKIIIDDAVYSVSVKDELTLAQYVDVEATFEEEGNDSRLSEILAIVCLKKGEKYDSKILKERKKSFQDLKMNEVFPLLAFFLQLKKNLLMITTFYSKVVEQTNQFASLIRTSAENGDGIRLLPKLQMMKYRSLMKSLQQQLSQCSTSYVTDLTKHKQKKHNISLKNSFQRIKSKLFGK